LREKTLFGANSTFDIGHSNKVSLKNSFVDFIPQNFLKSPNLKQPLKTSAYTFAALNALPHFSTTLNYEQT